MGVEASRNIIREHSESSPINKIHQSASLDLQRHNNDLRRLQQHKQQQQQTAHFSDYSLFPDRFEEHKSVPKRSTDHLTIPTSKSHQQNLSKYAFRLRTSSTGSDQSNNYYYFDFSFLPEKDPKFAAFEAEKRRRIRNSSQGDYSPEDESGGSPRSMIIKGTSKQPQDYSFFDFTMIPDKMEAARPRSISCGNKRQLHKKQ